MSTSLSGALEIRGAADALLDEPLLLHARGAGPDAAVVWQARYLDDDARVWRASATHAQDLSTGWAPAKAGTGSLAALASLRPVGVEVRVQGEDGRTATRTLTRRLLGQGVRLRRWRDLTATLHLPAAGATPPVCAVVIDATAGATEAQVAALAAPLLAARGVLTLTVGPDWAGGDAGERMALARERLAAVPVATGDLVVLPAAHPSADPAGAPAPVVVLPPGVGARRARPGDAADRAAAWDALLATLGARPRESGTHLADPAAGPAVDAHPTA